MKTKIQALVTTALLGVISMLASKSELHPEKTRTEPLVKQMITMPHQVMQVNNKPHHLFSYHGKSDYRPDRLGH